MPRSKNCSPTSWRFIGVRLYCESGFNATMFLMDHTRARLVQIEPTSAAVFCHMVGTTGAVFGWNAACTTTSSSLSGVFLLQAGVPQKESRNISIQTFRVDSSDFPNIVNQDRHTLYVTDSGYFIVAEKFRGVGHHLPELPDSLDCLPYFSTSRNKQSPEL